MYRQPFCFEAPTIVGSLLPASSSARARGGGGDQKASMKFEYSRVSGLSSSTPVLKPAVCAIRRLEWRATGGWRSGESAAGCSWANHV